jgi:hypothetical protein
MVSIEAGQVNFRWEDYRNGNRQKTMSLQAGEFIRRFLIHVLPDRFHRIRTIASSATITGHGSLISAGNSS